MRQLPEKPREEEKPISLLDRVRPWLYMAAVFAGLGLFFEAIVGDEALNGNAAADSLLVDTKIPVESLEAIDDEDEEYLEYLETQYTNYLMSESDELEYSE